jgi:hypothetical protein
LIIGFFWSTVLVYNATFCINSANSQFFTMGEGWQKPAMKGASAGTVITMPASGGVGVPRNQGQRS